MNNVQLILKQLKIRPKKNLGQNFLIDKNNSNITVLMEPTPKYIAHSIQAVTNPASDPAIRNFLHASPKQPST